MAILSNYLPSTGWCRGYLATGRIGEIFDVGRLKYLVLPRYACVNDTPKLNSSVTGGIGNNILVTRTSKQSQNTRGILKKKFGAIFESRRGKSSRQESSPEWKEMRSKRNPTLRYKYRTQNIFSVCLDSTVNDSINQWGLLGRRRLWIPTCNAQDGTIPPTCRGTT